jgi:hypothetical protein
MATTVITRQRDSFDPKAWLGTFAAIGGGYALMADRRLAFVVDACDGEDLTGVMAQIVGQPERQDAIKAAIEQRQNGEA